jgi:hypothetical protein
MQREAWVRGKAATELCVRGEDVELLGVVWLSIH